MSYYEKAPEVQRVAEAIIDESHPHLQDAKHKIGYYFKHGGMDKAGKCKKCTALERYLTGKMFFIFIDHESWALMGPEQREALIDHELCHIERKESHDYDPEKREFVKRWANADDPDSWSKREHDVEEFADIISRHGLWEKGIEKVAVAVREVSYQMTLSDIEHQQKLKAVK